MERVKHEVQGKSETKSVSSFQEDLELEEYLFIRCFEMTAEKDAVEFTVTEIFYPIT
jgi:hypothetical protein